MRAPISRGRVTTCTYHCSACGVHFHSLEAFDAHRQGSYSSDDPDTGRRCIHPRELDGKLSILTTEGECRTYADPARNVTIWTSERTRGTRPWETVTATV